MVFQLVMVSNFFRTSAKNRYFPPSKGWHSGESTRLPPKWPGFNPSVNAICGLSLLLVLSFAPRGFSPGTSVFPSRQKPTFPNSNSTRNQVDEEPLCGCATSKSLFIIILFYLFNCNVSYKVLSDVLAVTTEQHYCFAVSSTWPMFFLLTGL